MSEWKEYKLSDFIVINPKVTLKPGAEHSFVEMKDLSENKKLVFPSQSKVIKGGARFQNFDTLFARITPCLQNGKICQVKGLKNSVGFGSTEFLVFRGKEGISDTNFVYYLSKYDVVRKFAEQNMVGTSGRQRVSKDAFENIKLFLPNILAQIEIAEVLSSIDDKIELNNKINRELETLAQLLFKQWFIDFEFPNECGEPYKSSGGEMKDSDLSEIPKNWSIITLNDIMDFQGGTQPPSSQFADSESFDRIRLIQIRDYYSKNHLTFIPKTSNYKTCNEKDIMIARYGASVGRILFGLNGAYNVALVKVIPFKPHYREFLRVYLNSFSFQETLASISGRSAQAGFNKDDFNSFKFSFPKDETLLESFENTISDFLEKILQNQKENKELENLRNELLPNLISGELQINDN